MIEPENLKTILLIRELGVESNVKVLDPLGGVSTYLGENFESIPHFFKNEPFGSFVVDNDVSLIIVDEALMSDSRYREDESWKRFIDRPADFGFGMLGETSNGRYVLYREDLK